MHNAATEMFEVAQMPGLMWEQVEKILACMRATLGVQNNVWLKDG